jgi:hypothetical protein
VVLPMCTVLETFASATSELVLVSMPASEHAYYASREIFYLIFLALF